MDRELETLRRDIADVDRELADLLRRRLELAAAVGRIKAERGQPIVVRDVEARVLQRARDMAQECGVSPGVMERIFGAIIHGSVERQHREGVRLRARGGKRLLVLGAAGGMGRWWSELLHGMGHQVVGVDPRGASAAVYGSLEEVPRDQTFDAVLVAVPLTVVPEVLARLAGQPPGCPVLEIASIKDHLRPALRRCDEAGVRVLSLHPMFGPAKNPYQPLTVVHAVRDDALEERRLLDAVLSHPYLDWVPLPFDHHDRLMGWLLGLSHLTGLLFAGALSRSGLPPEELAAAASTSFRRQTATSQSVLGANNPDLYFAIQRLNPHRGEVYAALTAALGELTGSVERDDPDAFARLVAEAAASLPRTGQGGE